MNVKENIGIVNALIRITVGLTLLALGAAKFSRMPWRNTYLFVMMCGAMKVAEGIVRYCPITALVQREDFCIQLNCKSNQSNNQNEAKTDLDAPLDYNPT